MANHISSLKRARQTEKRTAARRVHKSHVRLAVRHLREALTAGDKSQLDAAFKTTVSVLDKSVQKGVLHKNTASRYKSRLAARVKAAATA